MSEFCLSSTTKTTFSSLLFSDFIFFCSFILSHPLYFSYFVFFLPYLLKLLSFLSPLFITTSLLLLALLTVSPGLVDVPPESSESKVGFFLTTYHTVLHTLRSRLDDDGVEFQSFEGLEAYIVVFETSAFKVEESPVEVLEFKYEENRLHAYDARVVKFSSHGCFGLGVSEAFTYNVEENPVEVTERKYGEYSLESFLQGMGVYEDSTNKIEENEEVEASGTVSNEDGEDQRKSLMGKGSEASDNEVRENPVKVTTTDNGGEYMSKVTGNSEILGSYGSMRKENQVKVSTDNGGEYTSRTNENSAILIRSNLGCYGSMRKENQVKVSTDNGGEYTSKANENSEILNLNLGSFGSMRKEKEWKRTLACKLFEERRNVDEDEGMDLLWEAYESDSGKAKVKNKDKKVKKATKGEVQYYEDEDEDEEDHEEMDGQLCCLQALKFSTGKMNLGMRRPNLMRISKALKGFGWLHHVSRHGKKG
ncbi:hypothetical protein HHK36_027120 [Tetracentron sinense]|uniref:Uncharacterized protein n=1 Tax=Tetracentron sinense TaxID=13715 RepID=A0A834YKN5_TETSI|nr:hypothetical protein HHK36_027120 [Tetracentron sinense]